MIAREVGKELGFWKPIVVSHHTLQGLGVPRNETTTEIKQIHILKENLFTIEDCEFNVTWDRISDALIIKIRYKPTRKEEKLIISLLKAKRKEGSEKSKMGSNYYTANLEKKLGVEITNMVIINQDIISLTFSLPKNLKDRPSR